MIPENTFDYTFYLSQDIGLLTSYQRNSGGLPFSKINKFINNENSSQFTIEKVQVHIVVYLYCLFNLTLIPSRRLNSYLRKVYGENLATDILRSPSVMGLRGLFSNWKPLHSPQSPGFWSLWPEKCAKHLWAEHLMISHDIYCTLYTWGAFKWANKGKHFQAFFRWLWVRCKPLSLLWGHKNSLRMYGGVLDLQRSPVPTAWRNTIFVFRFSHTV